MKRANYARELRDLDRVRMTERPTRKTRQRVTRYHELVGRRRWDLGRGLLESERAALWRQAKTEIA